MGAAELPISPDDMTLSEQAQRLVRQYCEAPSSRCAENLDEYLRPVVRVLARGHASRWCPVEPDQREFMEDVVQLTMIKLFKSICSFRGECSLRTWLDAVTYNEAQSFVRQWI